MLQAVLSHSQISTECVRTLLYSHIAVEGAALVVSQIPSILEYLSIPFGLIDTADSVQAEN